MANYPKIRFVAAMNRVQSGALLRECTLRLAANRFGIGSKPKSGVPRQVETPLSVLSLAST
ncbi:hypothetical protein ACQ4N7_16020 [Nodosilinea sp. AN01ver1]